MTMRIDVPDGIDPRRYVMTMVGSPRLLKNRNDSWDAQYFNDSSLTPREREAMRVRAAHVLGCANCVAARAPRDMSGHSEEHFPEAFYDNIFNYATWPGYTERERLAIEFYERYATGHRNLAEDNEFWVRLKASFNNVELADLCILSGMWDSATKMYHLLLGPNQACDLTATKNTSAAKVTTIV